LAGRRVEDFPKAFWELERVEPVYEVLPGWRKEIRGIQDFEDLPKEAKKYVRFVEEALSVPVALIGTGPEAQALIVRRELWS
jgi:adenylosuccinate synthase